MCEPSCPCMQFTPLPLNPCSCGMYEKGSRCPFCEITTGGVSRKHRVQPSEQEELDAIDARLATAEAAGRLLGAPRAGTSPETPVVQKPKRKRRSKEEMAEARAEEADRIRRLRRRVTPDWLADQDLVEADFVAAVRADAQD